MIEEQAGTAAAEAPVEPMGAEVVAETPAPRPLMDRMKNLYPDREFTDDELESAVMEEMDKMQGFKDSNDRLVAMFDENPELLAVMRDVAKGASLPVAIARNIDLDEIKPIEGDPDYEEWNKAAEGRKTSAMNRKKMADELSANLEMSSKEVQAFAEENGYDEEKVNQLLTDIDAFVGDVVMGKLTKNTLSKLMKAIEFETAVAEAEELGTIKGKNEAHLEKKVKKEKETGDGMPALTATGSPMKPEVKPQPKDPFMEAMDEETTKRRKLV